MFLDENQIEALRLNGASDTDIQFMLSDNPVGVNSYAFCIVGEGSYPEVYEYSDCYYLGREYSPYARKDVAAQVRWWWHPRHGWQLGKFVESGPYNQGDRILWKELVTSEEVLDWSAEFTKKKCRLYDGTTPTSRQ